MNNIPISIVASEIISVDGENQETFQKNSTKNYSKQEVQRTLNFFETEYLQKIYPLPSFAKEMIPARLKRRMSTLTQLIVCCACQCIQKIDYQTQKQNIGIVIGTGWGELETTQNLLFAVTEPEPIVSPTQFHNSVHNTAAGYLGIILGIEGATLTISQEYHTFESSLETAMLLIQSGQTDTVLMVAGDTYFNFSVLDRNQQNYPQIFSSGCTSLLLQKGNHKSAVPVKFLHSNNNITDDALKNIAQTLKQNVSSRIGAVWLDGFSKQQQVLAIMKIWDNLPMYFTYKTTYPHYPTSSGESFISILNILQNNVFFPQRMWYLYQEGTIRETLKPTLENQNILYISRNQNNSIKAYLIGENVSKNTGEKNGDE